ncbi:response regulator transcription factor [Spirosoma sp. BT702]|uniref:Response regulator transcription factor n=1 Tax=Spirosoma profusum TaxID=2771354 RepID=A0A926XYU6_9BACT|nr:LytTR family DNA-binding domain-containing protein [Spirosoma profusum]MBD2702706.1 response regulator transcription factor [Spirosoma profusum]
MKIKCLLVDDEPIALDVLAAYVNQVDGLELAGKCRSAVEAFTFLQSKSVDLLFLDIQMPQLSGLELLRTLPQWALQNPPKTIITSAYREYALDGYELDVLDYLIKPIPFERFIKAIGKAFTQKRLTPQTTAVATDEPFLFVKEERQLIRINLGEIISLESLRDYVKITTLNRQVTTRQTLGYYEELLPSEQFLRIHRSFIVAKSKILSMTETSINVAGQTLPIGRYYKAQVVDQLQVRNLFRASSE